MLSAASWSEDAKISSVILTVITLRHLRHTFLLLKVRFSYRITPQSVFSYRVSNDCFIYYESISIYNTSYNTIDCKRMDSMVLLKKRFRRKMSMKRFKKASIIFLMCMLLSVIAMPVSASTTKLNKTSISPLDFLMYNRIKQIGIWRWIFYVL